MLKRRGGWADTTKYAVLGFTKIHLSNHLLLKHDLWKTENEDVTHVPSCYSDTNLIDFIHQTGKRTMFFCMLSSPPIYVYILQTYTYIYQYYFLLYVYSMHTHWYVCIMYYICTLKQSIYLYYPCKVFEPVLLEGCFFGISPLSQVIPLS